MTDALLPPRRPPTVGELQIAPGCAAATMPRRLGVVEHAVDAQPFAVLIYSRAERVLLEPPARGLTKRRAPARSVSFLPAGLASRWLYESPIFENGVSFSVLHLRFTPEFERALELGPGRSLQDRSPDLGLNVRGLARRMELALQVYERRSALGLVALQSAVFAAAERFFCGTSATHSASTLTDARRRALIDYVHSAPLTEISVTGMADVVGLSPSYFAKVLKSATGRSPFRWALQLRNRKTEGSGS